MLINKYFISESFSYSSISLQILSGFLSLKSFSVENSTLALDFLIVISLKFIQVLEIYLITKSNATFLFLFSSYASIKYCKKYLLQETSKLQITPVSIRWVQKIAFGKRKITFKYLNSKFPFWFGALSIILPISFLLPSFFH